MSITTPTSLGCFVTRVVYKFYVRNVTVSKPKPKTPSDDDPEIRALLDLVANAKTPDVEETGGLTDVGDVGRWIIDKEITDGREKIWVFVAHDAYKRWALANGLKKVKNQFRFAREMNLYFAVHWDQGDRYWRLNSMPFDISTDNYWRLRKAQRDRAERKKRHIARIRQSRYQREKAERLLREMEQEEKK